MTEQQQCKCGTDALGGCLIHSATAFRRLYAENEQASAFTFFPDDDPAQHHNAVVATRTNWGFGPTPDAKQWAVRHLSYCLNRNGKWEFEPLPSSRDDEFLARCRFDRDDAIQRAREAVSALSNTTTEEGK